MLKINFLNFAITFGIVFGGFLACSMLYQFGGFYYWDIPYSYIEAPIYIFPTIFFIFLISVGIEKLLIGTLSGQFMPPMGALAFTLILFLSLAVGSIATGYISSKSGINSMAVINNKPYLLVGVYGGEKFLFLSLKVKDEKKKIYTPKNKVIVYYLKDSLSFKNITVVKG